MGVAGGSGKRGGKRQLFARPPAEISSTPDGRHRLLTEIGHASVLELAKAVCFTFQEVESFAVNSRTRNSTVTAER